jgi:hypothetical protein
LFYYASSDPALDAPTPRASVGANNQHALKARGGANPFPSAYWEALRQLAELFELMKFTLIYDDELPAGGNSSKPEYAARVRNKLHVQLADLWDRDIILRTLARTARTIPNPGAGYWVGPEPIWSPSKLPDWDEPIPSLRKGQTDFCAPTDVSNVGKFIPLVRNTLYLACDLNILFLRHDDDLRILRDHGDLDNRIKTLFDGLRQPKSADEQGGIQPDADPLYVLLEDDALIHSFSVRTGKLAWASCRKTKERRSSNNRCND